MLKLRVRSRSEAFNANIIMCEVNRKSKVKNSIDLYTTESQRRSTRTV